MAPKQIPFIEPETFSECEERIEQLKFDCRDIEAQLGDRNKAGKDGERLDEHDYWKWRNNANVALNYKRAELGLLKKWKRDKEREFRTLQSAVRAGNIDPDNPTAIIIALYDLSIRSVDFATLGAADQAVLDLARQFIDATERVGRAA